VPNPISQVPDNRPLEAPLIGQDTSRISEALRTGISVPQDSKNLMLMNDGTEKLRRHPEVLAAQRRASKDRPQTSP
jgi:hypothetical protein